MIIHLKGNWETKEVWLNGKKLNIKKSQKIRLHSEQFNWGYGGSGPAQLALAISLELFNRSDKYQHLKFQYIAALPQDQDIDQEIDISGYVDNLNTEIKY